MAVASRGDIVDFWTNMSIVPKSEILKYVAFQSDQAEKDMRKCILSFKQAQAAASRPKNDTLGECRHNYAASLCSKVSVPTPRGSALRADGEAVQSAYAAGPVKAFSAREPERGPTAERRKRQFSIGANAIEPTRKTPCRTYTPRRSSTPRQKMRPGTAPSERYGAERQLPREATTERADVAKKRALSPRLLLALDQDSPVPRQSNRADGSCPGAIAHRSIPRPATCVPETARNAQAQATTLRAATPRARASPVATSRAMTPRATTSRATTQQVATPRAMPPRSAAVRATATLGATPRAVTPRATTSQNTQRVATPRDTPPRAAAVRATAPLVAPPRATVARAAAFRDMKQRATTPRAAAPQTATSSVGTQQATTPRPASARPATQHGGTSTPQSSKMLTTLGSRNRAAAAEPSSEVSVEEAESGNKDVGAIPFTGYPMAKRAPRQIPGYVNLEEGEEYQLSIVGIGGLPKGNASHKFEQTIRAQSTYVGTHCTDVKSSVKLKNTEVDAAFNKVWRTDCLGDLSVFKAHSSERDQIHMANHCRSLHYWNHRVLLPTTTYADEFVAYKLASLEAKSRCDDMRSSIPFGSISYKRHPKPMVDDLVIPAPLPIPSASYTNRLSFAVRGCLSSGFSPNPWTSEYSRRYNSAGSRQCPV